MLRSEDFAKLVAARPFTPIRIHTTDGASYEVRHPEMILVGRRALHLGVPSERHSHVAQDIHRLAILHIARVEELAQA